MSPIRLDGRVRHPDVPRPSAPLGQPTGVPLASPSPLAPIAPLPPGLAAAPRARPRPRVKRGKGQRRQRTVRLSLELDARLEQVAASMGISLNEAIRAAIIVAYGR